MEGYLSVGVFLEETPLGEGIPRFVRRIFCEVAGRPTWKKSRNNRGKKQGFRNQGPVSRETQPTVDTAAPVQLYGFEKG